MESLTRLAARAARATSRGPSRLELARGGRARARRRASTCSPRPARARARASRYLLPALESGQRVVVATATKALQEQLLDAGRADRGRARSAATVRVAVLKGRQNYLCRQERPGARAARRRADADGRRRGRLRARCGRGSTTTETGDRAELDRRAVGDALGGARRRRRPLRRPPLPVPRDVLRRGGARRAPARPSS